MPAKTPTKTLHLHNFQCISGSLSQNLTLTPLKPGLCFGHWSPRAGAWLSQFLISLQGLGLAEEIGNQVPVVGERMGWHWRSPLLSPAYKLLECKAQHFSWPGISCRGSNLPGPCGCVQWLAACSQPCLLPAHCLPCHCLPSHQLLQQFSSNFEKNMSEKFNLSARR